MAEPIRLERHGAVAVLVLDDPPLNLFGAATFEALASQIGALAVSDARALVWRAEGEVFSGGVDVHNFDGIGSRDAEHMFSSLVATVRKIEALPIPTLALIDGLCLTAAWEVALGCDLIWASRSARFGLVEAVVGLTPGAGGTQRMAERAGPGRAREFVMTGGLYEAETLERWGVLNRVVEDGELLEKGMRFAERLAAGPTRAHGATKRLVRAYLEGGVDRADRETPKVSGALFETEDLRGAVRSFLDEGPGKATFEGR
ncbi:MAG: enoyl-CoA hydratase/isomerase family protein [Solirubrobacterales bacterium]